ncbi:MAG: twin-arginine translocation signal domain-containing protein [Acidimicrobiia bacterium]
MAGIDRRNFLTRSSIVVAAAGVAAAVPGVASGLVATEAEAPAVESTIEGEDGALTEPLVAHVRDLASGEIGVFSGTREIVVHDPGLASRLFRATR